MVFRLVFISFFFVLNFLDEASGIAAPAKKLRPIGQKLGDRTTALVTCDIRQNVIFQNGRNAQWEVSALSLDTEDHFSWRGMIPRQNRR